MKKYHVHMKTLTFLCFCGFWEFDINCHEYRQMRGSILKVALIKMTG